MAKNYSHLHGVMEILREGVKLPCRNKKTFLFIFLSTIFSYFLVILLTSILAVIYLLTDSSMVKAFHLTSMDSTSPKYAKQVFKISEYTMLLALGMILLMTVVLLFSMVATINVSAMSYLGRELTVKDLFPKIKKIWIRPVVTWFYISLLSLGYCLLIGTLLVLVVLGRQPILGSMFGILLILLTLFVSIYFALVWMLSVAISVMEDCFGLQAHGKAEEVVEGRKVVGLVLTFGFMILSVPIALLSMIYQDPGTVAVQFYFVFAYLYSIILRKMSCMMKYTVFYFECKQSHGEQGEVEEEMGYSKVSTAITLHV